jgi:ankyrin repeat protein
VPSLKILAGLAAVTYTASKDYKNTNLSVEIIEYLTLLDICKNDYTNGLIITAAQGKIEFIQDFIDLGASVETQTKLDQATPLLWATARNHLSIITTLQYNGANMHAVNIEKSNALMIGACYGHYDVCQYLIKQGININEQNQCKYSALMFAAISGQPSICKLLIDNGAFTELTNKNEKTALHLAAEKHVKINGHEQAKLERYENIMRILLDAKIKVAN